MSTATPTDPFLLDAITLMNDINRRLLPSRINAMRLTWRKGSTRVDCRVLDGEICAVLAPSDRAP